MKPMLRSALATGAVALLLAAPAARLEAAPGSPVRSGPAAAIQGRTVPEATPVHDRWDHRHRPRGRHHGNPGRQAYRHRPHRHIPHRHIPHRHRPHRHRPHPHWGAYLYWGFPHPCFVARPWRQGHWRHHHHRHYRGHRRPVPRHRHVRCYGGFTVVLPLLHPRPHAW